MERVDELTRKEILKDVESKVKKRAKILKNPVYLGITKDYVVHMRVESSTGNGSYVVRIKLDEYSDLEGLKDLSTKEKVRLAISGDLSVHCDCPAFKYWGYEYIVTQLGTNSHTDQGIYPEVRNPRLEGILCKHCYRALKIFGKYWSKISKDIEELNFLV